ncbi:uncharacterized protein FPRN_09879 [Fusarium proliferatum]|nr:uncharacterized protein FPRN_09879 [Fusarium proliferatum]
MGGNEKIQAECTETLEVVHDIKATSQEIQNEQMSTKERDLLLSLPIASNAIFDSTDVLGAGNPCLEGTQRAILTEIHEWAEDPTAEMIFWLHGLAGTGKSTVALTVADALKQRRSFTNGIDAPVRPFLGASFFFKQGDVSRNNIQAFFPTTAASLAEVFPDFKTLVAQAIEENLAIGTKAPQQQLETLIAKRFSALDKQSLVPLRLIVVVDALDECLIQSEAVNLVTMLVGQLKDLHRLPQGLHRSVLLDKIKRFDEGDDTKDDIMLYLTYTLAQLANNHGVPKGCLTKSTIKELRDKADGLFIYAATACRFLDAEDFDDEEARQERLDLILESTPDSGESGDNDSDVDDWEAESPKNKIDEIYRKVLSFPDREKMSPRTKQRLYNDLCMILGFLVVLFKPATIPALKKFLPSLAQSLDRLLKKLHAIVSVPWNESAPLELVHQSFRDFISSRKRSKKLNFQVQENKMHKEAFVRCLDIMSSELHKNICELRLPGIQQSEIPQDRVTEKIQQHLRYACRYWVDHLSKLSDGDRRSVGLVDGGNVHKFLETHFLHWLETMILIEDTASAVPFLDKLQLLVQQECDEYYGKGWWAFYALYRGDKWWYCSESCRDAQEDCTNFPCCSACDAYGLCDGDCDEDCQCSVCYCGCEQCNCGCGDGCGCESDDSDDEDDDEDDDDDDDDDEDDDDDDEDDDDDDDDEEDADSDDDNDAPDCRYGSRCTNMECGFNHPTAPCWYGSRCSNMECLFRHSKPPCRKGSSCANKRCSFRHPKR